jgi:hypothetical protein
MPWLPTFPTEEQRPFNFQGAPIAGVAALKQQQQQYLQKQLLAAMHEYAQNEAANTVLESAPQYGLPAAGDLAGTGAYGLKAYSDLNEMKREQALEQSRVDTEAARRDLYGIHGDLYNARIGALKNQPQGGIDPGTGLPYGVYTDANGQMWRKGRYGDIPVNQPKDTSNKPLNPKQLQDQFGVDSAQLMRGGHGVVEENGQYRYTKSGETPTHVSFSTYDEKAGPKNVYSADQVEVIRKRQGISLSSRAGAPTADKNLAPGYGVPVGGPPVGTRRTINGKLAEWDGTGWVAVGP